MAHIAHGKQTIALRLHWGWIIGIIVALLALAGAKNLFFSDEAKLDSSPPAQGQPPQIARSSPAPAPAPLTLFKVPNDAKGFVEIPQGTKEVHLAIRKTEWTPWIRLPNCNWEMGKTPGYPLQVQRWEEKDLIYLKSREDRFDVPQRRFRLRGQDGELVIFLDYN